MGAHDLARSLIDLACIPFTGTGLIRFDIVLPLACPSVKTAADTRNCSRYGMVIWNKNDSIAGTIARILDEARYCNPADDKTRD